MRQRKSWFKPNHGNHAGRCIIAQIYFRTDKSHLDTHDLQVLSELAAHLRPRLQRERVELSVVGHADHRGSARHNKRLGRQRASSVAHELDRLLRTEPHFSVIPVVSHGEHCAKQGTQKGKALASDRRVDVWSTGGHTEEPALEQQPPLMRPMYRYWAKHKPVQYNWGDPTGGYDPTDEGIRATGELLERWIGGKLGKQVVPLGDESQNKRRYKSIDATHRVNVIRIDERYIDEQLRWKGWLPVGEMETWETHVTYEWGPPQPFVRVILRKDGRRTVLSVNRAKVASDPFFFPLPKKERPR